ncbi:hypothetical protein BX659_12056 [Orenia metallireducens]|jgi:hypothetical protein|uniref:Uncharacterized protein n=1 Tax=Orenia metallireducens TaxID=1413210 RepID=A0A285H2V4_9FIRM|nr:hypothetical protein BX659_12056 [Orenia metallireducens]SNY28811.1 hypothetical protein SAMN06265827_11256 [Orenia metallireducens]
MGGNYLIIIISIIILYFFSRLYLYYLLESLYNRSYLAKEETDIDIDKIKDDYIKLFDQKYLS